MQKYTKYLILLLSYIIVPILLSPINEFAGYVGKNFVVFIALVYFWKDFKIRFKFDIWAIVLGIVIFIMWVSIDNLYPHLGEISFNPKGNMWLIGLKLFGFLIVAPLVEEIITRDFLMRGMIDPHNFDKILIGKFQWFSCIVTILFFGFAHNRWLAGLIAGIILNYLVYSRKDLSSPILAHFTANLMLAGYILITHSWTFW